MVEDPLRRAEDGHAVVAARSHCKGKCDFRMIEFLETLIQVSPVLRKFALHPFAFIEDLHWYLFSASEKFEDDFHFDKEEVKSKNSILRSFCSKPVTEAAHTQRRENGPAKFLPRELHSTSQHEAALALNSVCVHLFYLDLFCASLTKISLKVIASSLEAVLAYKRFRRNALILDSGGNLYLKSWNGQCHCITDWYKFVLFCFLNH